MNGAEILRNAGLHPTAGRLAVLESLRAGECLAAREVAQRLARRPHIPPATVYRALSSLCGAGLARRIPSGNGAVYMLAAEESAPQLVCSRCGKVEKISSPEVRRYNTALKKNRGGAGALLMLADCNRKECG
ncbi:MAG: Fur family transcriptional regulator [Gammaproteobacteria bacterium]